MKKFLFIIVVAAALLVGYEKTYGLRKFTASPAHQSSRAQAGSADVLQAAFNTQSSGVPVQGEGQVTKLLADDNQGSRHQRFLLTLPSGQTLLVAHNIDLAPKITSLKSGDTVAFNGVYEWNAKGGVVHWTHRAPAGRHAAGWLKHAGQTYQ
ncbi:DUF3465 domain-containing protein [Undibacterium sp. Ren11W]|uniref:DUF3465 domain-containing protein n=1 Tax=Undibacterium sp. Ren11W TaxID=3413045 RepID=UPI003BF266BF